MLRSIPVRGRILRASVLSCVLLAVTAGAAAADVCVAVDEARDTLPTEDRTAAILLVERQFELGGERIVTADCPAKYTLSHVRLGNTITVTLTGPKGQREGTAIGLDDLPALYSQMVRSILTGRSMDGLGVVDRTNVTSSQAAPRRVGADTSWYARLGYGNMFGDRSYGAPSFGFGYRVELDSFGIDVSFLNIQVNSSSDNYSAGSTASAGSFLKLEGLYFLNPVANKTAYFGGGVSLGGSNFGEHPAYAPSGTSPRPYTTTWEGHGLQGEITGGYEFARATSIRLFVQADAILPFYKNVSTTVSPTALPTTTHRYAPSVVVSVGLGWQRGQRRRP